MIGKRIRNRRKQERITQKELGASVGKGESTVSEWESEKRSPDVDLLPQIARALHTSVAYLMGWTDRPDSVDTVPETTPLPDSIRIPLLGTIACGTPVLAEENIEEWVEAPAYTRAQFALRCRGDSMKDARILDGDLVCIRQQEDVEDGQVAAVLIDDEATLKRVYHLPIPNGGIVLQAANSAYPPITVGGVDETRQVRILGLATYFISKVM